MADDYETFRRSLTPANPGRLNDLMAEDNVGREPPPAHFKNGWPQPGAWNRLLGPQAENFIRGALTYGPMGLASRGGAAIGEGAVWAHRASKPNSLDEPSVVPMKATDFGKYRDIERELNPTQTELAENFLAAPRAGGRNARDYGSEKPYWSARAPDNANDPVASGPLPRWMLGRPGDYLGSSEKPFLTRSVRGPQDDPANTNANPKPITDAEAVQRYLDGLNVLTGARRPPELSVIDGSVPPPKGPYEP